MLRYNRKAKKRPVGGEQYHEYGMTFRGDSFEEVCGKLKRFRINNNIPVGNPENDVLTYYAAAFPFMVVNDEEPAKNESLCPDYVAWRQWIYDTWKTPPKQLVTTKEAEFRTAACIGCKYNIPMVFKSSEETEGLKARVFMLRRGQGKNLDRLGFCGLHKADCSAFVFCEPAEQFSKHDGPHNHPPCWVGKKAELLTPLAKPAPITT